MNTEDLNKLRDQAHRAISNQSMAAITPKTLLDLCDLAEKGVEPCEPEKN